MVEQKTIAGIHPVSLPVVHRYPVGVELGYSIWAARVKRRSFPLRTLLYKTVELRGGGLVNADFQPDRICCFKYAQGAEGIHIGGVLRSLETHCYMALGAEVVDLVWLYLLNDPLKVAAVA